MFGRKLDWRFYTGVACLAAVPALIGYAHFYGDPFSPRRPVHESRVFFDQDGISRIEEYDTINGELKLKEIKKYGPQTNPDNK